MNTSKKVKRTCCLGSNEYRSVFSQPLRAIGLSLGLLSVLVSNVKADEHGDSVSNAYVVAVSDRAVECVLDSAEDEDWFTLQLPGRTRVFFFSTGSTDPDFSIYNDTGSYIADNADAGKGQNFQFSRMLDAGTYYFCVKDGGDLLRGDYTLRIWHKFNAINFELPVVEGTLAASGDMQFYRLVFPVAETTMGTLYTTGMTDTLLEVYDSDGDGLYSNPDAGYQDNALLERGWSSDAGERYIAVWDENESQFPASYSLNMDLATSPPMIENERTLGRVDQPNQRDYFRLEVPLAGEVFVYTTGGTDTRLELYNSNWDNLADNADAGADKNAGLSRVLSAGTYFVEVRGGEEDTTGDYMLHVLQPATARPLFASGMEAAELDMTGDKDLYALSTTGGTVELYTTGTIDTRGYLNDESGSQKASNTNGGDGNNFRILKSVTAGTYYVEVSGEYPDWTIGDYSLWFDFVAADLVRVDKAAKEVAVQGVDYALEVLANTDWTFSCDESWIHVSETSGSGIDNITISVDENLSGSERRGELKFNGEVLHVVHQSAFEGGDSIAPTITQWTQGMVMSFETEPGISYRIESSIDGMQTWQDTGERITGTGAPGRAIFPCDQNSCTFRVVEIH